MFHVWRGGWCRTDFRWEPAYLLPGQVIQPRAHHGGSVPVGKVQGNWGWSPGAGEPGGKKGHLSEA